ncbi:hypothetical protein MCOR25_005423 [Pyricularia grisea]|nr:hypothetical protein MCOR25_005423 [Pyricularia grisea]
MADRTSFRGACMCGGITFSIEGRPEVIGACYCRHCQMNGGSTHQVMGKFTKESMKINDPKSLLKMYIIPGAETESGKDKEKYFCSNCGCMPWTVPQGKEGKYRFVRTSYIENGLELKTDEEWFK